MSKKNVTLFETKIEPENGWLEDDCFHFMGTWQVRSVSFREGNNKKFNLWSFTIQKNMFSAIFYP